VPTGRTIARTAWPSTAPTEEISLQRGDASFHDCNSAVPADGVVAGLDLVVVAPVAKTVVIELRTAVADQVFRFGADGRTFNCR